MSKLSPPMIAGSLPAFYSTEEGKGIEISIPFSTNRAVSLSQVKKYRVKIKTIKSSSEITTIDVEKKSNDESIIYINNQDLSNMHWGQFYKIQVAYIDNSDEVGYFSSVGLAKYTYKPDVSINGLEVGKLKSHSYTYTGVYLTKDSVERVYSYCFNLYDNENNLVNTSGDLLHDLNNDEDQLSEELQEQGYKHITSDSYTFMQDLPSGQIYRIEYVVTTINGLIVKSHPYRITQKQSISPELNATLHAALNYDNGYIDLRLWNASTAVGTADQLASGFFILSRACEDTNYTVWEEIYKFSLMAEIPNKFLHRDFTIEQGKKYCYGIQQHNAAGLRSNRLISNIVYADFEDAFLFDGKRQLKIKYNPKVSSFKKDLLETKVDTIGGKYPFIFRNGRVYYSEFPISGLISYQMDEENLFLSEADYGLTEKTTNLTGENIAAERIFKMKVLEWLTNGEPKVFRSPTEGNFIVRLMNSSLSPNDTLGRMLHTFTSTAYEVADFNYSTLGEMNFIDIKDQVLDTLQWETVEIASKKDANGNLMYKTNLLTYPAKTIRFNDMVPGETVTIVFKNGVTEKIKIGITGSYYVDVGMDIEKVYMELQPASAYSSPTMTYSYEYTKQPAFNNINAVAVKEIPQHQFIGEHDILKELLYVYNDSTKEWIRNPKVELIELYSIDAEKRAVERLENKSKCIDPFLLYELGTYEYNQSESPMPSRPAYIFKFSQYYDIMNTDQKYLTYEPYLYLNGTVISVNEKEKIHYTKPGSLTELKCGNGILVNISYQMGIIEYNIENDARTVGANHYLYKLRTAMETYESLCAMLATELSKDEPNVDNITVARNNISSAYTAYVIELVKAQKEEARRRGEIA